MIICGCGKVMRTNRNGMVWLERDMGKPYALWSVDRLLCECGQYAYTVAPEPMASVAGIFDTRFSISAACQ